MTSSECVEKLVEDVETILNNNDCVLHAVVNNAACLVLARLEWQTRNLIQRQLQVNLQGPADVCRSFLPVLRSGSRIINISSPVTRTRLPLSSVYAASKVRIKLINFMTYSDMLRQD